MTNENIRKARCFIWIDPNDCDPPHGLDMTSAHDAKKVDDLEEEFQKNGFNIDMPALVGYPLNGRIQLLSGTHRHLAASRCGIKLPVTLWLRSDVEETWGTELWDRTLEDISVRKLQEMNVKEGIVRSPFEAVDLAGLYQ